jgi:hypothetical protein
MAEVIHRYVGKDGKLPKPTPEEQKERAAQRAADAELTRERAEAVRTARMRDQLLLAKARGDLVSKATAQAQAGFLLVAFRQRYSGGTFHADRYRGLKCEAFRFSLRPLSEIAGSNQNGPHTRFFCFRVYFAGAGAVFEVSIRIFQSSPSRITDQYPLICIGPKSFPLISVLHSPVAHI